VSIALVESGAFEAIRMTFPAGHGRSISAQGFARLLERLHPDSGEAAHAYERLHRALVKFFDWRGVSPPDECADEVLDRLAHKLEDTTMVNDVTKYAHGIARLVALERRRGPAFSSIDEVPQLPLAAAVPADDPAGDRLHDCFDRCLEQLPEESRALLLRYYEGERTAKISNRRRLASMFGLSDNALRSRVQRLRDRLEQCVHACGSQPMSHTA
jgi:DNA-directed RNA polymerase specialized sigma24 family protein